MLCTSVTQPPMYCIVCTLCLIFLCYHKLCTFPVIRSFKIATWNLCLGLMNKKDYVSQMLLNEKIDICCMQEIELKKDIDHELLSFNGYNLMIENNVEKSRVGIFIRNEIKCKRRSELEGQNNGIIIIDVDLKRKYRIMNLYRVFNPTDGRSQRQFFSDQLSHIKAALGTKDGRQPITFKYLTRQD